MALLISLVFLLVTLAIAAALLAGMWKTFEKMGRQGWEGIVPFYNFYVLLQVLKQPTWFLVFLFIPLVNLAFLVLMCLEVAKGFGKDVVMGILTALGIGWVILGFKPATWQGSQAKPGFGIIPVAKPVG